MININIAIIYLLAILPLKALVVFATSRGRNPDITIKSSLQIISYEIVIAFSILTVSLVAGSLDLSVIVTADKVWWSNLILIPNFVLFIIASLAITGSVPFSLNDDSYKCKCTNMTIMAVLTSILFLGGWKAPFNYFAPSVWWLIAKSILMIFVFALIRKSLPNYRQDQIINLAWKKLIPFSLFWLMAIAGMFLFTGQLIGGEVIALN